MEGIKMSNRTKMEELLEQLKDNNKRMQDRSKGNLIEIPIEIIPDVPVTKKRVKKDIQDKTDEYIQKWIESKKLESELKELRKQIEPYMYSQNITSIEGSTGGSVRLMSQDRVEITSRYTTYRIEDIGEILPKKVLQDCIVNVIDAEKLEGLALYSDVLSKEMLEELKVRMPVISFRTIRP